MVAALRRAGFDAVGTDIATGHDFLQHPPLSEIGVIVTNPPYTLATEFIERALELADDVAMLLRCDFDHAKAAAFVC